MRERGSSPTSTFMNTIRAIDFIVFIRLQVGLDRVCLFFSPALCRLWRESGQRCVGSGESQDSVVWALERVRTALCRLWRESGQHCVGSGESQDSIM